jgi:membrane protease YdiL (CAAX protease family)
MQNFWLLMSIGIVAADWAASLTSYAVGTPVVFAGIRQMALYFAAQIFVMSTLIWLLLRGSGESFAALGFGRRELRRALSSRAVWRAVGSVLLLQMVVGSISMRMLTGNVAASTHPTPPIASLFRDSRELPWWVCSSILAGFGEELERAFCLTRLEKGFGAIGLVVAVIVHSAVFASRHAYQGFWGVVAAALAGLVFSMVFLRSRRLADAVVAHGIADLVGVALLYAAWAR